MVRKTGIKKSAKKRVIKKKAVKKKSLPKKRVVKRTIKRKTTSKKRIAKRTIKKVIKKKTITKKINKKLIGKVTHFFGNLSVAVIELNNTLKIGDKIMVEGATTSFKQIVSSMQIEREKIKLAKKGDDIGMKVRGRVRPGDKVYKL